MTLKISLVTGGAGFLGSFLCEKLLSMNHRVIAIDNLLTGSIKNINHLKKNKNFSFIKHDIIEKINLEADEIFNLACPASPVHYQSDPVQTIRTNVLGSMNMLELAKKLNCKIFQASTSEIYGDPEQHPQSEEYWGRVNPIGIRSCYDEGKRCAETLIDTKVARIFNTYGPRMSENDGRVISNFITQAIKSEDITIYGNGMQTRSFCYVDDLINGIVQIMNSEHAGPINLGNPEEMTINKIAELIVQMCESKSKIINLPLPQDDPLKRKPNIERANQLIGWKPRTSLYDGMFKTIEYFKKEIS